MGKKGKKQKQTKPANPFYKTVSAAKCWYKIYGCKCIVCQMASDPPAPLNTQASLHGEWISVYANL